MTPPDADQPVLDYAPPAMAGRAAHGRRARWSRQFVYTVVGIVIVAFFAAVGLFFLFSIIIDGRD